MAKAPSVTSVEIHGFVWWLTSSVAFALYLVWAYVPDALLQASGFTYYPAKHWAVALPAWLCATVVWAYWAYESLNLMATPSAARRAAGPRDAAWRSIEEVGLCTHFPGADGRVPPLVDIPQAIMDMILEGERTPQEAERIYMLDQEARAAKRAALQQRRRQQQQQQQQELQQRQREISDR